MTPVEALEHAVHCLDRAHETGFKTKAFLRALQVVRETDPSELERLAHAGLLTSLDGIGDSTAQIVAEALDGKATYLERLDAHTTVAVTHEGERYLAALRGDCHLHSRWSDGGATVEAMVATAIRLGHEFIVLTDHSPRLTVAHGLDSERLARQLDEVAAINERVAPFRVLTGIEVDILEDGSLDHDDDTLERLDVVVASLHSKLRMDERAMTARMLRAISSPHVDILGHCTGRMISKREPSQFDVEQVFTACAATGTAVEINCRPERLDPPKALLRRAVELGCLFAIDTDAHATGQLEWLPKGCDRAAECAVPIHRVVNTWSADDLLDWTRTRIPAGVA